jgi:recombination associated protein RdgC
MWFKNLRAYRLTQPIGLNPEQLAGKLQERPFRPCAAAQPVALGWVAPLGDDEAAHLVHAANGRILLCMRREEKLLPATVVREQLQERISAIEAEQARKVYRKERMTLKDEVIQDCLPRAFSRNSRLHAILDTRDNWLLVDSASAARAEELLNLLRDCIGSFPVLLPQVNNAPAASMTAWLAQSRPPGGFELGRECELREAGEDGGVVRVRNVDLLSEEVEVHLNAGKQVSRLALSWDERVSLVLAEDLVLRRLRFSDALLAENEDLGVDDPLARLDADFLLLSEALTELQARVMALFGGEAE